jgi:hypothetical protein
MLVVDLNEPRLALAHLMIFVVFIQPLTDIMLLSPKQKWDYNAKLISSNLTNPHKLWHAVNNLFHRRSVPVLPSSVCLKSLSQSFATFFCDKIYKLRTSILSLLSQGNHNSPHVEPPSKPNNFSFFHSANVEEVSKRLHQLPVTSCDLDPIPASPVKQCASVLVPTITKIINLSVFRFFPKQLKTCSVCPLLKKSNLDKESLANCCPVSYLSFLFKLTERIVRHCLMNHLSENNLLNSYQSAYVKSHSTESTALSVHDYHHQSYESVTSHFSWSSSSFSCF